MTMAGDDTQALVAIPAIRKYATVRRPRDSDPPILAPAVREAVRQWMVEIGAADELEAVGLKPRRTAMFSGPPGTGKTTLAHHIAARLGLPLVLIDMASVIGMYVGQTGQQLSELFKAVEDQGDRMVLLLDEFDAIAQKRGSVTGSGAEKEKNSIITHLLQYIDRFPGMMIAATNRADDIDPAIWRRFGMHLEIVEPDDECRFAILRRYLSPMSLDDHALDTLVEVTAGASPAVLRQLMEGIKRDLILSPRFERPTDAAAVFSRIVASVRPHGDATLPPLWKDAWARQEVAKMEWPPAFEASRQGDAR